MVDPSKERLSWVGFKVALKKRAAIRAGEASKMVLNVASDVLMIAALLGGYALMSIQVALVAGWALGARDFDPSWRWTAAALAGCAACLLALGIRVGAPKSSKDALALAGLVFALQAPGVWMMAQGVLGEDVGRALAWVLGAAAVGLACWARAAWRRSGEDRDKGLLAWMVVEAGSEWSLFGQGGRSFSRCALECLGDLLGPLALMPALMCAVAWEACKALLRVWLWAGAALWRGAEGGWRSRWDAWALTLSREGLGTPEAAAAERDLLASSAAKPKDHGPQASGRMRL
jgi:hypothetical protein